MLQILSVWGLELKARPSLASNISTGGCECGGGGRREIANNICKYLMGYPFLISHTRITHRTRSLSLSPIHRYRAFTTQLAASERRVGKGAILWASRRDKRTPNKFTTRVTCKSPAFSSSVCTRAAILERPPTHPPVSPFVAKGRGSESEYFGKWRRLSGKSD